MDKYRIATADGSPDFNAAQDIQPVLDSLVHRMGPHMGQGFTLLSRSVAGAKPSQKMTLDVARERSRVRLAHGDIGFLLEVTSLKDRHSELLHKVSVGAPYVNLPCTEPIVDEWWTAVRSTWSGAENWGAYVYKHVAGTNIWSYHAYGQALDVHDSAQNMNAIADYAVMNAAKYRILQVIHNRRVWEPGMGWRYYDGLNPHYDHVHTSHAPERNEHVAPRRCLWG